MLQRLARMGIASELGPGGTTVVGTLALGPEPFPTLGEAVQIRSLRFTTTNSQRIKCLEPPALFQLPMLSIAGCESAQEIESRVRTAWKERVAALRRTLAWLEGLGVDARTDGHGGHLAFPLGGEDREARARLVQPDRIILPSRGPLSGRKVQPAGSRLLTIDSPFESSAELEIAVTNRLQRLERNLDRAEARRRAETAQRSADEIGIMIGEKDCWGNGFATECIELVANYAFDVLNLHKLTAGCYANHAGSEHGTVYSQALQPL